MSDIEKVILIYSRSSHLVVPVNENVSVLRTYLALGRWLALNGLASSK